MGWNYLSIKKLQLLHRRNFRMDGYLTPHFVMNVCNCVSTRGLKWFHSNFLPLISNQRVTTVAPGLVTFAILPPPPKKNQTKKTKQNKTKQKTKQTILIYTRPLCYWLITPKTHVGHHPVSYVNFVWPRAWQFSKKLYWGGCQRFQVTICSSNGLVLSGDQTLPGPLLVQIYVTIWRHKAILG